MGEAGRSLDWQPGSARVGGRALPVPYCDPKCPHQRTPGVLSECECGGAEREYRRTVAERAAGPGGSVRDEDWPVPQGELRQAGMAAQFERLRQALDEFMGSLPWWARAYLRAAAAITGPYGLRWPRR